MNSFLKLAAFVLFSSTFTLAVPSIQKRSTFSTLLQSLDSSTSTTLTAAELVTLDVKNAISLAGPAYCSSVADYTWTCGTMCDYVSDVEVLWTGGDGNAVPRIYLGYSASLSTLVLAHAGTNSTEILSLIDDLNFGLTAAGTLLQAAGASSGVKVHTGFQSTWAKTAAEVLSEIETALAGTASSATTLLLTGHSLGAALSLLDGVYLASELTLPSTVSLQVVTFGLPRVGNQKFANFVDSQLPYNQIHVTNENDIIPHLPPELLGFIQPKNEVWQRDDTDTSTANSILCSEQESYKCSNSLILDYSIDDHDGPYLGIAIQTATCE